MMPSGYCAGCCDPCREPTAELANATICEGTTQTLSPTITGTGPFTYQWASRTGADPFVDIPGATSRDLEVTPAETTDYRITVTNDCGEAQATATVTVNVAPEITEQPTGGVYDGVTPVTLTVAATGTAPLTYQWQSAPAAIGPWSDIPGATTNTYEAEPDEDTWYQVIIGNECGSATTNPVLVQYAPIPENFTAYMNLDDQPEGSPISFSNPGSAGGTWSSALVVASAGGPNGRKYVVNPDQDSRVSLAGVNGSDLVSIAGGGLIGGVCRINPSNCVANNDGGVFHLGTAFNLGSCNTGPRVQPAVWYDGLVQGPTVNVTAGQWFAFVFRWDPVASVFWFRINGGAWQSTSAPSGINGANTAVAFNGTRAGVGVTSAVDGTEYMTRINVYDETAGDELMAYLCARCGLTD